jgi:mannosyltransferase OCH1-like enzyme
MFPKIIWQTHNYTIQELPEHLKKASATWKNLNPEWDHRYVDHIERAEMIKKYSDLFDMYKNTHPQYQADLWRYVVTYQFGGVYADMDSVCIKPLDYLLDSIDECEMVVTPKDPPSFVFNDGYGVNNANFAVKQHSKIMKNIINVCKNGCLTAYAFNLMVLDSNKVSYEFSSALHDSSYKLGFDPSFIVDDYGVKITYKDYLIKHSIDS